MLSRGDALLLEAPGGVVCRLEVRRLETSYLEASHCEATCLEASYLEATYLEASYLNCILPRGVLRRMYLDVLDEARERLSCDEPI